MSKRLKLQLLLIGSFAAILVICHLTSGYRVLSGENILNVLLHAAFPMLASWGMMFIFTGGLMDLSVGANLLLAGNVGALFACQLGWGYPGLILGAVLTSVIATQFTTHCSITLGIPAWVSGLGGALVLEAILAQWSNVLSATNETLPTMDRYRGLGMMPGAFILMAIGLAAAYICFSRTTLGINLQAVGANPGIASAMGINVRKTIILATVIGSVYISFSGISDISMAGKLSAITGLNSLGTISKALSATLLANSMSTIFVKPAGIVFSSIIVAFLFNILTIFGVPSGTMQNICLGLVIIVCGILSHLRYKGVVK